MATVFGIEVAGETYDIEDTEARETAGGNKDKIGNLSSLETTEKTNLVAAINELKEDVDDLSVIGTILSASGSVHPSTLNTSFEICSFSLPKGKWIITCFSDLNVDGQGVYNNYLMIGVDSQVVRTSATSGGGSCVTRIVEIQEPTTVQAIGYAYPDLFSNANSKQSAKLTAVRIA